MATERTYYSDEKGVRITGTRAIFGSTMYSMANLSSVRTLVKPPKRSGGIWTALVGVVALVIGATTGVTVITVAGVVILLLGIFIAWMAKGTYYVMISSASGESEALSSTDESYINSVTQALNEAIISRG